MNLAVALGVAAGTAVLTGALLVGDSMKGSLRDLTFQRLGPIDGVVLANRFFRQELAGELATSPDFPERLSAVPGILLVGSLARPDGDRPATAAGVNLLGCSDDFWRELAGIDPANVPEGEIALNGALAARLGVGTGDSVLLHLPGEGNVPGEVLLGRRLDTVEATRVTVGRIIPDSEGWLGRFALRPDQKLPENAYVPLRLLQKRLDRPGRVNAIFLAGADDRSEPPPGEQEAVQKAFHPTADDYGIRIERVDRGTASYINITTDRLLFEPPVARAILDVLKSENYHQAFTYLANTIDLAPHEQPVTEQPDDGRIVPYSTITALRLPENPPVGPFRTPDGQAIPPLQDKTSHEKLIVLTEWTADSLGIPRDRWPKPSNAPAEPDEPLYVYVSYFEPETTHGVAQQRTERFRLAAVVADDGPAGDRHFTPTVPGLTDKESIDNWEVPFEPFYDGLIRKADDLYYRQRGLTPKAFVSLPTGHALWGSRFGKITSFRVVPSETATVEGLGRRIAEQLDPAAAGFALLPLKSQGLAASVGATPFNVLFLMFSFFVIAAAVMLVALLFRLGIERRAAELGVLLAVGLGRRRVGRMLAAEGLCVAAAGSLVGILLGVGYAGLMIVGLQTLWLDAIVTPFLTLHVDPLSLLVGMASGVVVSLAAILWAVRATRKVSGRRLLDGQADGEASLVAVRPRWPRVAASLMLLAAVLLGLASTGLGEEAQAGAFFGAGAMVLAGCLLLVWSRLRNGATGPAVAAGSGNLLRLAVRNAARNPGRSSLSAGLIASTAFLIIAVSAFRLDPTLQTPSRDSGNGGFSLVGQSDQPIYQNLGTAEGRERMDLLPTETDILDGTTAIAFRVRSGDDATCLNLYQPRQPRVLGVPDTMIDRGGFAWSDSAAETPEEQTNPWLLLRKDLSTKEDGPVIPVVLEKNTALYALHLWGGVGSIYEMPDGRGGTLRLKVVGLMANGIFQGDLLVAEDDFLNQFPETDGYRFFLFETPPEKTEPVEAALQKALAPYGFTVETTGRRLARFLAVQNTYLLTFSSLGGLGLLLGTFGLAAVQMRNVLERRRELALLRAAGFRRAALAWMVLLENSLLLLAGLACGALAALVAVLPHLVGDRAMIPWLSLALTLGLVLAVGLLAGLGAVRAVVRAPLLASLRSE